MNCSYSVSGPARGEFLLPETTNFTQALAATQDSCPFDDCSNPFPVRKKQLMGGQRSSQVSFGRPMANQGSLVAALEIEGHAKLLQPTGRILTFMGYVLFKSLDNVYKSYEFFKLSKCRWRLHEIFSWPKEPLRYSFLIQRAT